MLAEGGAGELGGGLGGQRLQGDEQSGALTEGPQEVRAFADRVLAAVRDDDQDRRAARTPGEGRQPGEGFQVGPVRVVDDHDERGH